jgi:hypothetical protein
MYLRAFGRDIDTSHSKLSFTMHDAESSVFRDRYGCPLINPGPYLRQRQFSYNKDAARYMTEDKEGGSRTKTSIDGTSGPLTYEYLLNCEHDG